MILKRTILVPTDFSKNAVVAGKYALGFAKYSGYKLHFIHAFLPFKSAFQTKADNESERQEARREAESQMDEFRKVLGETGSVSTSFGVSEGHLVNCLDQFIREEAVAFIVIGTHGQSGSKKNILGSNTFDVATSVPIPVVIVPEDNPGFELERVVFFTNYSNGDINTFEAFKDITAGTESSVTLVHIFEESSSPQPEDEQQLEEWKNMLQRETGYTNLKTEIVPADENIYIINHIIDRLEAQFTLLTLTQKKGFFDKLLYKSLAKSIILHPRTPVLITTATEYTD